MSLRDATQVTEFYAGDEADAPGNATRYAEPESILQEAQRITRGDRNADYGHPLEDWSRIAEFWTIANQDILKPGASFDAERGLLMMILMKLSRDLFQAKRDTRVDIAGYADCMERTREERERRRSK